MVFGIGLTACAGRDPHPLSVVQPQDAMSDCAMIRAEIEANNVQVQKLLTRTTQRCAECRGLSPLSVASKIPNT